MDRSPERSRRSAPAHWKVATDATKDGDVEAAAPPARRLSPESQAASVGIDVKDAATVTAVVEDDHFAGPGETPRRTVVVRLLKLLPLRRRDVPPGARVRVPDAVGRLIREVQDADVRVYVVYASTYTRYDASRITADLRRFDERLVRLSVVRALMHSVRLPQVKETIEYEEAL